MKYVFIFTLLGISQRNKNYFTIMEKDTGILVYKMTLQMRSELWLFIDTNIYI